MVKSCCVPGCTNILIKDSNIRFVRFPENTEMKIKWQKAIGRKAWELTEGSILCCEHFPESSYAVPREVLRYNAVPSLFVLSQETNQSHTDDVSHSQSPTAEIEVEISQGPNTLGELNSTDFIYYPVSEDEEELTHPDALLESEASSSNITHYKSHTEISMTPVNAVQSVQQVLSIPIQLSTKNKEAQTKFQGFKMKKYTKKYLKQIKNLNKRKRGLDKLFKMMSEASAIHDHKCHIETEYKKILGER